MEPECINLSRVRTFLSEYPLLRKVEKVVDHGIHVYPDPEYQKNPYEPLRPQEKKLMSCLCKNALKMHEKGKILIFQLKDLTSSQLRHISCNASFWVPKVDSDDGRICVDPSNRSDGRMPLNGGLAKILVIAKYGRVECPLMVDIVVDWILYKEGSGLEWSKCCLAKEDCKTYFNQFKFHPKSCLHMCRRVSEEIIIVELFGNYGHTALPSASQVVGKAMEWTLRNSSSFLSVKCPLHLFFDDFMMMGSYIHCFEASQYTQLLIKNVLGPGGHAANKSCFSQSEVILGYLINMLDPRGASIGPKQEAVEKMLHLFFNFNPTFRQTLHFWQVIVWLILFIKPFPYYNQLPSPTVNYSTLTFILHCILYECKY